MRFEKRYETRRFDLYRSGTSGRHVRVTRVRLRLFQLHSKMLYGWKIYVFLIDRRIRDCNNRNIINLFQILIIDKFIPNCDDTEYYLELV